MADTGTSISQLIGQLKTSNSNLPNAVESAGGRGDADNRSVVVNVNVDPQSSQTENHSDPMIQRKVVDSLDRIYDILNQQLHFSKKDQAERRMELQTRPHDYQKELGTTTEKLETASKEKDEDDDGKDGLGSVIKGLVSSIGTFVPKIGSLISTIGGLIPSLGSIIPKIAGLITSIGGFLPAIAGILGVGGVARLGYKMFKGLTAPDKQGFATNADGSTRSGREIGDPSKPGGGNIQTWKDVERDSSRPMTQDQFERERISKTVGGESARRMGEKADQQPMTESKLMEMRTSKSGEGLGETVAKYESGKKGTSTVGYDTLGGTSYGKYQIASKTGTFDKFLNHLEKTDPEAAKELRASGASNTGSNKGSTVETWKKLSGEGRLQQAEHEFIKQTHFDPAIAKAEKLGYDVNDPRVREMVWSGSIQHGKIGKVLEMGAGGKTAEEQVQKFYDARRQYVKGNKYEEALLNRYAREEKDVLAMDVNKKESSPTDMASKDARESTKISSEGISQSNMVDPSALRIKGGLDGQATKGGESHQGTMNLARSLQARENELPGGLNRFTAFNDEYHHKANPKSTHTQGLATDITLKDGKKSTEAAEYIKNHLMESGLSEKDFKIIDEYKNPSKHSTGGHIHVNFANKKAAEAYAGYTNQDSEAKKETYAKYEKEIPEGKGYAEEESEQEDMDEEVLEEKPKLSKLSDSFENAISDLKTDDTGFGMLSKVIGGISSPTSTIQQSSLSEQSLNQDKSNVLSTSQIVPQALGSLGNVMSSAGVLSGGISSVMSGIGNMQNKDTRGVINSVNQMAGMGRGIFSAMGGILGNGNSSMGNIGNLLSNIPNIMGNIGGMLGSIGGNRSMGSTVGQIGGMLGNVGGMLGNTFGGPLGGLIGGASGGALSGLVGSAMNGGGIGDALNGLVGGALNSSGGVGGILNSVGVAGFGGSQNPSVSKEGSNQYPGREGGFGGSLDEMMLQKSGIQREEGFPTIGGMGKEEYLKRQSHGETFDPKTGAGSGGVSKPIEPRSLGDIAEGVWGLNTMMKDAGMSAIKGLGGAVMDGIGSMFGFGGNSVSSKGIGKDAMAVKENQGGLLSSMGVSGIGDSMNNLSPVESTGMNLGSLSSEGGSMIGGALDSLQSSFSSMMGTGGGSESASSGGGSSVAVGNAGGGGGSGGGGSPGFKSGDQRAGSSSGAMGIQMGVRNEESILQKAQYSVIRIV